MRLLLSMLFAAVAIGGFAQDRGLTPEDVATMRSVGSAALSPDGSMIAYTVNIPRTPFKDESGTSWTELHIWDAERGSRPFITGKQRVSSVRWRPDGKAVSFLARRKDDKQTTLYILPVDGGEARPVLSHKTGVGSYEWSPDGSEIAFIAREPKNEDRDKLAKKGFDRKVYEEEQRFNRLWVAKMGGDEPETRMIDVEGHVSSVRWNPDGKRMAIYRAPTALVDDSLIGRKVVVIDNDGGVLMEADNPGKLGQMKWNPKGDKLAFQSAGDVNDPSNGRLFVADAGTKKVDKYFMEDEGDVGYIAWQDDDTIVYLWEEGVETSVRTLDLDGGAVNAKLDDTPFVIPGLNINKGADRIAIVGDSPKHPREVFLWEKGQTTARRITNSNPWLDDVKLAKQEVINYEARDGLKLQGLLIRPLNEEAGKRYPLILTVHGGPEAHYSNGWLTNYSMMGQMAAAQGYAVFYPNYRASTGRGIAFSKMDHGRPAKEQFDDLVDGVKHLVDMGLVDEDRVGVTGGSYGGYATAWCATALTEHFAAGVMFVGISNKISKSGTSDIPEELFLVHDRKRLWDDWQLFLEASPIFHVKKAKTPLLIMHGEEDTRVHPAQSMELYRHLKTLGQVPVRLVFYPGEGHGNRKSGSRYDYTLRAMRWFDHYLKGEGGDPPPTELDYSGFSEAGE